MLRFVKFLFGLIMVCLVGTESMDASTFINGAYYDLNKTNLTASITYGSYDFGGYAGDVIIPSYVTYDGNEYTVTAIANRCFYQCDNMTSLVIPATVRKVSGTETFYGCSRLKSVTLEDAEASITIPGCVYSTQYGNTKATFHFAKLEKVYVGRDIILSSNDSSCSPFYGQDTLSDVTIGPKVKNLPGGFLYRSAISSIVIPDGVKTIGKDAFGYCENLKELVFPTSVTELGNSVGGGSGVETVYVGDNVNEIPVAAFHTCTNLKTVFLGSGITSIKSNAFAWTSKLSKVYLFSEDVISIDDGCFPKSLSTIYVPNPSRYTSLFGDYYLDNLLIVNNSTSEYNGQSPNLSYYNNTPITDVTFSMVDNNLSVGTYTQPVTATFKYKNWSTSTKINATYTITPALVSIIANNVTKAYGTANPELTCSYFGFKNGEDQSVLTQLPKVETTATTTSNVGTYPIVPSGAEAQNYTFNYERGTLTITKAEQTIEWNQQFGTVSVGDVFELTASSSSGLPIKYTTTDETIAEIYTQNGKKFVEFLKPGNVSIRANQEGNENYNEADRVSKSINVGVNVSGITLDQSAVSLSEGSTIQLTAIVSPQNSTNVSLTWESTDPSVASVDQTGKVTALKKGTSTVRVKLTNRPEVFAQCEISVVKLVDAISLNITSATLTEGQSLQLEANVQPDGASNKVIEWTSSNTAIATVSQSGKVTAISKGSVLITAKSTDGSNIVATCNVSVIKLVYEIVLNKPEMILNEGQSAQLIATVSPSTANNKNIVWSSSNESIASIDQNGLLIAHTKGSAVITAKATDGSNVSAFCYVTVNRPVTSIYINKTVIDLEVGDQETLTAYAVPSDATNTILRWYSENVNVATVEAGIVSATGEGVTNIVVEATDGTGVKRNCEVRVRRRSGIPTVSADDVRVYVENSTIYITDLAVGETVYFYHVDGVMIQKKVSLGETISMTPANGGIYSEDRK